MFSFINLTRLSAGLGSIGGIVAYYQLDEKKGKVFASWTSDSYYSISGQKWDFNWDRREPEVKDSKNGENEKIKPTAVRHIILIRHGQYNTKGSVDCERSLTDLGKQQAQWTASRLKELELPYTTIVCSTMTRAKETACQIHNALPNVPLVECSLLEEGAPHPPEPPVGHWKPPYYVHNLTFYQDGARIEAAFRKYFYRADVKQEKETYDIIVCHANVIRYFVCRALQYPAEGWLRLSLRHASITWLSILPSGRVLLRCYGDAGYMPPYALTTS